MKLIIVALLSTALVLWGFFALISHTQPEPDQMGKLTLGFIAALAGILPIIIGWDYINPSGAKKGSWIIVLLQFTIIIAIAAIYTFTKYNQVSGIMPGSFIR